MSSEPQPDATTVPYRIATYACSDCDVLTTVGESTHPFTGRPDIAGLQVLCPVSGHPMFLVQVNTREVAEVPSHEVHAIAARKAELEAQVQQLAAEKAAAELEAEAPEPAPETEQPAEEPVPEPEVEAAAV